MMKRESKNKAIIDIDTFTLMSNYEERLKELFEKWSILRYYYIE